jgi:hypothetical protein
MKRWFLVKRRIGWRAELKFTILGRPLVSTTEWRGPFIGEEHARAGLALLRR